jgi:DDE family transposase/transposase-like protein DUF772
MLGKRSAQRDLFEVGNVFRLELDPHSFHGQLASVAARLFSDGDFAAFYDERQGRPSVPPSQLALLTLLQHEASCSDAEAVARSAFDLRWAAVLGCTAGAPLCAKSTFQLFRAHLVLHDGVRTLFERSLQQAQAAGLLGRGSLKIAVDTKPILGRGAVEDTYNLLGTGIQQLIRALAKRQRLSPEAWAEAHALSRYFAPSLKGSADLDWSNAEARDTFLSQIVADARRLLHWAGQALGGAETEGVREGAQLLEQLLLQDVIETPPGIDGSDGKATIRPGTATGRIPSATDPDQRHGRKSERHHFTGYKGAVAVDRPSQIILDANLLDGAAPDTAGLLEQVQRIEERTGQPVAETLGDCAYGSGETRQAFADAGRELLAKVPQEKTNGGLFPKSAFVLDLVNSTVTCPQGHTIGQFTREPDGGQLFSFGARCGRCPLRQHCTTAGRGRSVSVHPQEGMLGVARAYQETAAGRAHLRERVVAEHRLARLGQLGMGQARYRGRAKTQCQLLLLATIANLRRVWAWVAAQSAHRTASVSEPTAAAV